MWTTEQKWECANRELVRRVRVYAKQVADGALNKEESGREIAVMSAIVTDYHQLMEQEKAATPEAAA